MLHDVINILKIVHISITLCTNQKNVSRNYNRLTAKTLVIGIDFNYNGTSPFSISYGTPTFGRKGLNSHSNLLLIYCIYGC